MDGWMDGCIQGHTIRHSRITYLLICAAKMCWAAGVTKVTFVLLLSNSKSCLVHTAVESFSEP